jgi:GNAT superfamily N-acetyltransferase
MRLEESMRQEEPHDFRIRLAVAEDVPTILRFIQKLARYERLSHEVTATEEILRENLFGERRGAEVILGEFQHTPVGFALYFHNFSTFLGRLGIYIEDLHVDEEHRGHGFGHALFAHIARLAMERGCGRLEWSVLDWNSSAIRFYENLGAVALSDWTTYRLTGEALDRVGGTNGQR